MLQTPQKPKKKRPLMAGTTMDPGIYGGSRQHGSYLGLPAKYSGIPNFMQYRIGPGAELQEAALSYADLRWSNFRGANLRRASFCESILWGAILTNADLSGADLSSADLTGVDLVGADLTDAVCEGACFLGARYGQNTRFPSGFGCPEEKGMISQDDSYQVME